MNYMANMASGNSDKINADAIRCSLPAVTKTATSDNCCVNNVPRGTSNVQLSSLYSESKSKTCPPPTPEQFALYPKVAVPSSLRTLEKLSNYENCTTTTADQRFAKFRRWQAPVPCPPLPQTAQSVGISKPSTRACNLQTFY